MNGGKKISEERHFRVVDINGKKNILVEYH